jgi:hypothetical protein
VGAKGLLIIVSILRINPAKARAGDSMAIH